MLRKNQHKTTSAADRQPKDKKMQNTTTSSLNFWRKWLLVTSIFTALFGLAMVLLQDLMDAIVWHPLLFYNSNLDKTFSPEILHYVHLVYGILGAVMVGWGVLLFFYVKNYFASGDRQVWLALVLSVGTWYVIDSVFSIAMGYWPNAALNTVFGLLFFIPFAASSKYFKRSDVPYV